MNILILNGGPANGHGAACRTVATAVADAARSRGHAVTTFEPDAMTIKPCRGCFACWLNHPGTCAIKDDQEPILGGMAQGDLLVWITPVIFGGYGSALKKALDRSIPILIPFFTTRHGEVHHPLRYEKRRGLVVLGTLPRPDAEAERIFHHLAGRNALNLDSFHTASVVVHDGEADGFACRAKELLEAAEEAL
jgi:multimeric flavodoxin WrbA